MDHDHTHTKQHFPSISLPRNPFRRRLRGGDLWRSVAVGFIRCTTSASSTTGKLPDEPVGHSGVPRLRPVATRAVSLSGSSTRLPRVHPSTAGPQQPCDSTRLGRSPCERRQAREAGESAGREARESARRGAREFARRGRSFRSCTRCAGSCACSCAGRDRSLRSRAGDVGSSAGGPTGSGSGDVGSCAGYVSSRAGDVSSRAGDVGSGSGDVGSGSGDVSARAVNLDAVEVVRRRLGRAGQASDAAEHRSADGVPDSLRR
jgi:hypothetical protein